MGKKKQSVVKIPFVVPLIILAVCSGIFIYFASEYLFLQDDTYITLRYVKNFVNGNGLVFNIGERVEGYTCLLWVLLLSGFSFMGSNPESISQILSIGFGVATLFLTYAISRSVLLVENSEEYSPAEQKKIYLFNFLPVALLTFTISYIYWAISGMETTLFIALVLLGILFYLRGKNESEPNIKFAVSMVAASLARPEGVYIFAIIVLNEWIILFADNIKKGIAEVFAKIFSRKNIITYSAFVLPNLIYIALRYLYYGYLFPNTYYAKTEYSWQTFSIGLDYAVPFIKNCLGYGIVLLVPFVLFRKKQLREFALLVYLLVVLYSTYVIAVGGDVLMVHFRFFLVLLPLIFILFSIGLGEIYLLVSSKQSVNKNLVFAVITAVAAGLAYFNYSNQIEGVKRSTSLENGLVEKMKTTGLWLNKKQQQAKRPIVVAASTIGAVSYFSDAVIVDMIGLTDTTIAHNPKPIPEISEAAAWKERKYNIEYVLSRKPDFIYFSTGMKPSSHGERALFTSDEFLDHYYQYYFTIPGYNFTECIYKRKPDDAISQAKREVNPNYQKSFVHLYNEVINASRNPQNAREAIAKCENLIRIAPYNFNGGYEVMGNLYRGLQDEQTALLYYKKAIEADDYAIFPHYFLYQHYAAAQDAKNAAVHLEKLRRYAPDLF